MGNYQNKPIGWYHTLFFLTLLFITFASIPSASAQQIDQTISWKKAYQQGKQAFGQKKYQLAVAYFELAEQKYLKLHEAEGEMYEQITVWLADAQEKVRVTKQNNEIRSWVMKANKARAKGDYQTALQYYKQVAKKYREVNGKDKNYTILLNNLATLYRDLAQYKQAEPLYLESLRVKEKLSGKNTEGYAITLASLAELYQDQGEIKKAIPLYQRALETLRQVVGKQHPSYITTLNNLAEVYRAQGAYLQSIPMHEEAIRTTAATRGKKNYAYATYLNNLAGTYESLGKYDQAEPLFLEAKAIFEALFGKTHPRYGVFLGNLARLYQIKGDYSVAKSYYEQSVEIIGQKLGKNHPQYALMLGNLAGFYRLIGDYFKAECLLLNVVQIMRDKVGEKHPNYALTIGNLASIYEQLGLTQKAERLYQEAVTILEQKVGVTNLRYIAALSNLALFYKLQEQYYKAEPLMIKVNELMERSVGTQHPDYAITLKNLGELYEIQGRSAQAEKLFVKGKNILANTLGIKHITYAFSVHTLGYFYQKQGKFEKAEKLMRESLNIRASKLGKTHPDYAVSLNSLGQLYSASKKYAQAEKMLWEAQQIVLKTKGKYTMGYAATLNNLAHLYELKGEYQKAKASYLEAVQVVEKVMGAEHPTQATYLNNLAGYYTRRGNYQQAAVAYLSAIKLRLKSLQKNYRLLSEKERRSYFKRNVGYFENFKGFVIEYLEQSKAKPELNKNRNRLLNALLELQLNTQAQLLDSKRKLLRRITYQASLDTSLARIFKHYQSLKAKLAKTINQSIEDKKRGGIQIEQSLERINELEKKLYASVGESNERDLEGKLHFQFLQRKMKKGEALVSIIKQPYYDNQVYYLALIITSQTKNAPDILMLKNGRSLDTKYLSSYRNSMVHLRKSRYTYAQFWQPLDEYFNKQAIKRIYFSPDGVYHSISLNTIQVPTTKTYLDEHYDIRLITSLRDFMKSRVYAKKMRVSNDNTIHLVGRPAYDLPLNEVAKLEKTFKSKHLSRYHQNIAPIEPTSEQLFTQQAKNRKQKRGESGWPDLPGTELEVRAIENILRLKKLKVISRIGKQALELTTKHIQHPQVLHIATHGFFVPNREVEATAMTKKVEKRPLEFRSGATSYQILANEPMLRSGIALAGVASYEAAQLKPLHIEDGVLTAYEASQMDLRGTELVVLSACDTGLGEIQNGEGVYGLQRAFIVAGAKAVILSLWKVDDKATGLLMSKFYEQWLKQGLNKREAFRVAQQYLRNLKDENGEKIYEHPYYWGAFQMIGVGE